MHSPIFSTSFHSVSLSLSLWVYVYLSVNFSHHFFGYVRSSFAPIDTKKFHHFIACARARGKHAHTDTYVQSNVMIEGRKPASKRIKSKSEDLMSFFKWHYTLFYFHSLFGAAVVVGVCGVEKRKNGWKRCGCTRRLNMKLNAMLLMNR